ncbi:hypothetical protein [Parasitella parasitica]|uniref:Uncharacterized protein n=1 Tax=Parasitella parasitica TaxID=35722 RepID=A0A0B7MX70_9FUNG|nr:hypothetical protein [Parasitella parasitica]
MSQARNNNSLSKQNNNRDGTQRVTNRGPYKKSPQEIRNLAITYCYTNDIMSVAEAAKKLGVNRSTLSNQLNLYVNEGRKSPEKRGRKRGKLQDNFPELQEKKVSISGLWRFIVERIGFTLTCTKPVEKRRNCPETINARKEYINRLLEKGITYKTNCIFVDEAGFNANLIRSVGYSEKGSQSVATTQSKRALNISILAGISYHSIEGVSVKKIKGGTTGAISKEFVKGIMKKQDETNAGPTSSSWIMQLSTGRLCTYEISPENCSKENAARLSKRIEELCTFDVCYENDPKRPVLVHLSVIWNDPTTFKRYLSEYSDVGLEEEAGAKSEFVSERQVIMFLNEVYKTANPQNEALYSLQEIENKEIYENKYWARHSFMDRYIPG